ncbi:MAG: TdeIII family type II restriction endonuclease [Firmicutes bacterium]|nr:TdeIII family type II restriction endonuclease [Bacillota bacterium]
MDQRTRERIREHIHSAMSSVVKRRVETDPFLETMVAERNPFGYHLVPMGVWKGAKFERSFVTTLGQGIFEQIGRIIAEGTGSFAENQYVREIEINTFRVETIDSIIQNQRGQRGKTSTPPNLSEELERLASLHNDAYMSFWIKSDLYIRRPSGQEEFYSFKTVKPNIDQTAEAKKNLLLLRTGVPDCEAYFALPYNPAGDGKSYRLSGHGIPYRLFDMDNPQHVLIGSDLWNKIGDNESTYEQLLQIFAEVGETTRSVISTRYMET